MLIRLLVVVLTVVGPVPFRVCTCAASPPAQTPTDATAPAVPAPAKTCRCGHSSTTKGTNPTDRDARVSAGTQAHPCGDSHHDRDCPVVNPGTLVRDAGVLPAPDAPTDGAAPPAAVWVESLPLAGTPAPTSFERLRVPKLPLFITLLALRN
jgi:hypothetical protein